MEKYKKNIWKFYLFKILEGMFFAVPIFVLFWQENGLNLTEIMILQSIFSIVVVFLEIPTGYFSDRIGRKRTLIISSIAGALGIIIYSIGINFWQFLIGEILFAVAISLESGTLEAFLYENLKVFGKENEYKKIFGQSLFYATLAIAGSGIIGSFIAGMDLRYPIYASIPFFISMIFVALSFYDVDIKKKKKQNKKRYLRKTIKVVKKEMSNYKLKWIVIYSGVVLAFNQSALWIYQPYFKISGLDIVYYGVVFASFQVVAGYSSKYAHFISSKVGEKKLLLGLGFLVAVSFLLMSNFIFLFSFSFAFLQQFVRGVRTVIVSDYINDFVKDNDMRALMLSVESLFGRLLYSIILPLVGFVADIYSLRDSLLMLGMLMISFLGYFLWIFRKI